MNNNLIEDFLTTYKPTACPYCHHESFIKFGKKKNNQRYRCKNELCKKTFSDNTNKIWSHSKKDRETWSKFINLMTKNPTLKQCSNTLNIAISTSHSWRIKILNAFNNIKAPKLFGEVEMKKILLKENFKGNRGLRKLPATRKRVILLSGKDEFPNYSVNILPINYNRLANFKELVHSIVDKDATLKISVDRYVEDIIPKKAYAEDDELDPEDKDERIENNKNIINFSQKFNRWMSIFNGVSTKYLLLYAKFFTFQFYSFANSIDLNMIALLCAGNFIPYKKYREWSLSTT